MPSGHFAGKTAVSAALCEVAGGFFIFPGLGPWQQSKQEEFNE
jgi:hypothetical protein